MVVRQDPTIELKVGGERLRKALSDLEAVTPKDMDSIARTRRELIHLIETDLIPALQSEEKIYRAERNGITVKRREGQSKAVRDELEAKRNNLKDRADQYAELSKKYEVELKNLKVVAEEPVIDAMDAQVEEEQRNAQDLMVNMPDGSYGCDYVDEEMEGNGDPSITNEEMAATMGLTNNLDGTKKSTRVRRPTSKALENLGAKKPQCKAKAAQQVEIFADLLVEQADDITQKGHRGAAVKDGVAIEVSDE